MTYLWDKKIRARKLDAERGQIVEEFTARDILKEPNRFQIEAIIQAISIATVELIRLEEERQVRLSDFVKGGKNARTE